MNSANDSLDGRDVRTVFAEWENEQTDDFQPNLDVPKGIRRYPLSRIDPLRYNIVTFSDKKSGTVAVFHQDNVIEYLADLYIVFNHETPYRFDGCIYQEISTDDVARLIHQSVDAYKRPGIDNPVLSRTKVADIISKYRVMHTPIDIPSLGNDDYNCEHLVPFLNGLYNVDADVMLPFTPYIWMTYQLQCFYDPSIMEHDVEKIYKGIIPDDGTRDFFYQMAGFTMFCPRMLTPAIFLIYGGGQTGKSALQEAVTTAIGGQHVSTLSIYQISKDFMTLELDGKLMNVCGETGDRPSKDTNIDGELLKKLSDGQPITVDKKYSQPYTICNCAKLWFVSNTLPDFGDTSSGLYRRLYILPCRQVQDWDAQIKTPMQEQDAISWLINKCLAGFRRFLKNNNKFDVSLEMRTEMAYFTQQDNISDYIQTVYETNDKLEVAKAIDGRFSAELYAEYSEYVQSVGGRPVSRKKFVEKIRNEYNLELKKVACQVLDKKTTRTMYVSRH